MRVLHAGKFYAPVHGGIETVLAALCEDTAARWDVRVVVANEGRQTVRERRQGVDVVRVGTLARALSVSLSPGLPRELWWEPADCVVLHEPNPLVGTLLAIHRPARRLIVWHHSDIVRPAWANPTYGRRAAGAVPTGRLRDRRLPADGRALGAPCGPAVGSRSFRTASRPSPWAAPGSIRPRRWAERSRGCRSRACSPWGGSCTTRASRCCWRRSPGRAGGARSWARGRSRARFADASRRSVSAIGSPCSGGAPTTRCAGSTRAVTSSSCRPRPGPRRSGSCRWRR